MDERRLNFSISWPYAWWGKSKKIIIICYGEWQISPRTATVLKEQGLKHIMSRRVSEGVGISHKRVVGQTRDLLKVHDTHLWVVNRRRLLFEDCLNYTQIGPVWTDEVIHIWLGKGIFPLVINEVVNLMVTIPSNSFNNHYLVWNVISLNRPDKRVRITWQQNRNKTSLGFECVLILHQHNHIILVGSWRTQKESFRVMEQGGVSVFMNAEYTSSTFDRRIHYGNHCVVRHVNLMTKRWNVRLVIAKHGT